MQHHHIATAIKNFAQYRVYPFASITASTRAGIDFQSASKVYVNLVTGYHSVWKYRVRMGDGGSDDSGREERSLQGEGGMCVGYTRERDKRELLHPNSEGHRSSPKNGLNRKGTSPPVHENTSTDPLRTRKRPEQAGHILTPLRRLRAEYAH